MSTLRRRSMPVSMIFILIGAALIDSSVASGFVRSEIPEIYDDYEGVELAVKLAVDGKLKLAEKVLNATDARKSKNDAISKSNRERVLGLLLEEIATGKGDLEKASGHFSSAIKLFNSPEIFYDQQRVDFARQDYSSCVNSVRKLRAQHPLQLANATASRIRTAVKCFRNSAEQSTGTERRLLRIEALSLVEFAVKNQPQLKLHPVIASERVELVSDLGFNQAAADEAISILKGMAAAGQTGISSFALDLVERVKLEPGYLSRNFSEKILQAAQIYSPANEQEDIMAAKAKQAFAFGRPLASAMAFEQLAKFKSASNSQVYLAAIELYRLAGWRSHANDLVQLVADPKDRLRARISGFFERDETAKIAAMFPSLDRHLLDEEEWIYLGAFARLQSGGWREEGPNAPVKWLTRLKRPENRDKASILRQLVADCQSSRIGNVNATCAL